MELEFDKEIDSLLRKADRGVLVGDKPDGKPKNHLDTDELAAFAENAMPEKVRALHMEHLADCGRCCNILSGLIMMNAEAEPERAVVAAPAIPTSAEPWYRRFLFFPNLAYVMGGLVLIFGGLLTFSLLQNSTSGDAVVSQVSQSESGRGPMEAPSAADSTANLSANTAAEAEAQSFNANTSISTAATSNSSSNSAVPVSSPELRREDAAAGQAAPTGVTMDGIDSKPSVAAAAPPPAPEPKTAELVMKPGALAKELDDKDEKKRSIKDEEVEKSDLSVNSRQIQNLPRTQAGGPAKAKPGPTRDAQQNFPNRADNTFEMNEERKIGVRGFQRKNNVWYDNAYRGQTTTNIRRGTDEYKKLDGGLRSIAESLGGVIVVMWNGKAFRIQ
jgi:hypothetical protein